MPATVIAERIGWDRSMTVLKDRVRELRPLFVPPDPASRTEYQPGELAQCDLWFPPVDVPLGFGQVGRPPVLVMVSGYSRVMAARMIPSRQGPDLLAGHWALLSGWGAVPRALVWDNESAVGQWRGGRPQLTEAMNALPRHAGDQGDPVPAGAIRRPRAWSSGPTAIWRPRSCPAAASPRRRTSTPSSPTGWSGPTSASTAGSGCRPVDRWDADRAAMLALPPVAPVVGWRLTTRLPRDHYVRLDANDYSVHPRAVGRRVEVAADLEQVIVTCDGQRGRPRTSAAGRGTRASPTRPTPTPPRELRAGPPRWPRSPADRHRGRAPRPGRLRPHVRPRRPTTLTGAARRSPDGHQDHAASGRNVASRDRLPDPGAEGPVAGRRGRTAGRTGPGRVLDARGVPGRLPATRGRRPRVPRR